MTIIWGGNVAKAQAAVKYEYAICGSEIVKVNTQTGKIGKKQSSDLMKERWTSLETTVGISSTKAHNGYLYFTKQSYFDNCCYVCRIKKNGTGFRKLGKGRDFSIYKNKIYYTAYDFAKNGGLGGVKGIYCMSLNGKSKKKIISGYELLGIYSGKLYAKSSKVGQNRKIVSFSLNGKSRKELAKTEVDFTSAYVSDGVLYYDVSVDQNDGYKYGYYAVNLKNGKAKYHKSRGILVGVNKKYSFFDSKEGVLYYKKKGEAKQKKLIKGLSYVDIYSTAGNPYIIAEGVPANADASALYVINIKMHKYKRAAESGN